MEPATTDDGDATTTTTVMDDGDEQPPPLVFSMPQEPVATTAALQVLLHQVTAPETEQHDTGFVMWPSAVLLARWVAKHPWVVLQAQGDILELGSGCGLVGLTAATLLQQQQQQQQDENDSNTTTITTTTGNDNDATSDNVIFTDYNPTVLDNLGRNIRLNDLDDWTSVMGLDFFDQTTQTTITTTDDEQHDDDVNNNNSNSTTTKKPSCCWMNMDGVPQPQVSLILAADIIAYSNDATLVATTIQAALLEGGQAILMGPNENRRFGLEHFEQACLEVGLEVQVTANIVPDHILEQTSGGISQASYDFTMFTIDKPIISATA